MKVLQEIAGSGVVILTPESCKTIDAFIQQALEAAVQRGIAIGKQLGTPQRKERMTYDEVMAETGLKSKNSIRAWAARGVWHIVKQGSRCYVPTDEVLLFNKRRGIEALNK